MEAVVADHFLEIMREVLILPVAIFLAGQQLLEPQHRGETYLAQNQHRLHQLNQLERLHLYLARLLLLLQEDLEELRLRDQLVHLQSNQEDYLEHLHQQVDYSEQKKMKTRNQDYLVKMALNKIPQQQAALDNQHQRQPLVVLDNRQLLVCLNQTQDYLAQLSLLIQEQED